MNIHSIHVNNCNVRVSKEAKAFQLVFGRLLPTEKQNGMEK